MPASAGGMSTPQATTNIVISMVATGWAATTDRSRPAAGTEGELVAAMTAPPDRNVREARCPGARGGGTAKRGGRRGSAQNQSDTTYYSSGEQSRMSPRQYRLGKRAETIEQTRQRI